MAHAISSGRRRATSSLASNHVSSYQLTKSGAGGWREGLTAHPATGHNIISERADPRSSSLTHLRIRVASIILITASIRRPNPNPIPIHPTHPPPPLHPFISPLTSQSRQLFRTYPSVNPPALRVAIDISTLPLHSFAQALMG